MTVHDLVIANASGQAVRTDLNSALAAIGSNSSNSSAITGANSYPYQWQVRTDVNKLYMRDASTNTTWHEVGDVGVANLGLAKLASPTFTGVVEIANGTNGAPSIAFDSDTDTGLYRSGSNILGLSAGGTACHLFKSTASEPQVPVRVQNGTYSAPSYSFATDTNTGFYLSSQDVMTVTVGGGIKAWFNSSGLNIEGSHRILFWDDNNDNYIALKAPSVLNADLNFQLPNSNGTNYGLLQTDGSGNTSWVNGVNLTSVQANSVAVTGTGSDNELRIGSSSVANATSYIDFITANGNDPETGQPWDYNFRVIKAATDNGEARITNKGTGTFYLESADANGKIDFLGYSPATAHAWVRFNGATQSSGSASNVSSFNVSSITVHGTGDYTVNFTNVAKNIGHVATDNVSAVFTGDTALVSGHEHCPAFISAIASTGVRVNFYNVDNSTRRANPAIVCGLFFV